MRAALTHPNSKLFKTSLLRQVSL